MAERKEHGTKLMLAHIAKRPGDHAAAVIAQAADNALGMIEDRDRAGRILALRVLQSDLWKQLDDDELAAAQMFLPKRDSPRRGPAHG